MPTRRWPLWIWVGAALAVVGCTGDSSSVPCTTDVQVELQIESDVDGVLIEAVAWTLTGEDMPPMMGVIDTSAPGATASVEVFGLGPGTYTVELEASSVGGETTCRGASVFDVAVGAATEVGVLLRCKGEPSFGAVRVNGKFNICAELTKAVVAPLQTSVGNDIVVQSRAEDVEGDTIEYRWTATEGSFEDPSAPATVYTCEQVGDPELTISVSDDEFRDCVDDWTVGVRCVDGGGTGGTGGGGATGGSGGAGGQGGAGGVGGSAGAGGAGGAGGVGGIGGAGGAGGVGGAGGAGGVGGSGGEGGSAGAGGSAGTGGSAGAGGSGGAGGHGGAGGSGGSAGTGGLGGSGGGTGGTGGGTCEITIELTGS